MPRMGISYEEVMEQAEILLAAGQNPTLEKIRRGLGDRGSNTTISKYLSLWRGKRTSNKIYHFPKSDKVTYPETHNFHTHFNPGLNSLMPVSLNAAVLRVWEDMKQEGQHEIQKIKSEAQSAVEAAHLERDQIKLQLEQELGLAKLRIEDLQKALTDFKEERRQELHKVFHDLAEAHETIAKLQERQKHFTFIQEFLEELKLST